MSCPPRSEVAQRTKKKVVSVPTFEKVSTAVESVNVDFVSGLELMARGHDGIMPVRVGEMDGVSQALQQVVTSHPEHRMHCNGARGGRSGF